MPQPTRKHRKDSADARKADLIEATLRVIAKQGVQAASVRTVAKEANLAPGLVRYYFENKNELIVAAYEKHMADLNALADDASQGNYSSAKKRLATFLQASLKHPVVSRQIVSTWSGFFNLLLHDETMRASHRRSYDLLRLHLKDLIEDALKEEGRDYCEADLRRYSIAGTGILDGLWIEYGAIPEFFEPDEVITTTLFGFEKLLDLKLELPD